MCVYMLFVIWKGEGRCGRGLESNRDWKQQSLRVHVAVQHIFCFTVVLDIWGQRIDYLGTWLGNGGFLCGPKDGGLSKNFGKLRILGFTFGCRV